MRHNFISAGDAIRAFLKTYHLEDKVMEARILAICRSMFEHMGKNSLSKATFHNGHLTLYISGAALRQEIGYQKSLIMNEINTELGEQVIKSVSVH
ncbi:MAG TPA: DciA family protein [Bacteroidales bacterium]|nr:DciA family protein [Bacteroidales bacterium]HRZ49401.1 DciA family protein [Bacteroidales bacterium]